MARRVAHEIRNPLTPITLSAERILRQMGRLQLEAPGQSIVRECAETILVETASVKRLVDEFSQFSQKARGAARCFCGSERDRDDGARGI